MSESRESAAVTIGQAVEILRAEFPDVSPSLLRYLQREGLISPERKAGGHRLYSPQDIERIRTIRQWQAKRVSVSEIRRRLNNLTTRQHLPVVANEITAHLLAGELDVAIAMLEDLLQTGTPLMTICEDILTPVLLGLGDEQGNHLIPVDAQLELDERLAQFLSVATTPPAFALLQPVVLAACPVWERHDMPLRMQTALLVERGVSVHFLGSMVEKEFLIDAMSRLSPDVIVISMTIAPRLNQIDRWFKPIIDAMTSEMRLVVGGLSASCVSHLAAANVEIVGMETYSRSVDRVVSLRE